jgi:putative transposase
MGLSNLTVGKCRKRYRENGIDGLPDELRSGRPRAREDEQVAEVTNTAPQTQPYDSLHRSVCTMAE